MKLEDSTAYTARCFRGEPASCSCACPFHLDIRSLLEKVGARAGGWRPTRSLPRRHRLSRPSSSALCDQPCREHCQRTVLGDEAIALRDLEAACLRYAKNRKPESYVIPPKEQRVAVVGAGVAGLSCALNLAQKKLPGHRVREGRTAGAAACARIRASPSSTPTSPCSSPPWRRSSALARRSTSLDELADFDAVYVATGAGGDSFGLLESWDRDSVHHFAAQGVPGRQALRRHSHGGHRPGRGGVQDHRGVPRRPARPPVPARRLRQGRAAIATWSTTAPPRRRWSWPPARRLHRGGSPGRGRALPAVRLRRLHGRLRDAEALPQGSPEDRAWRSTPTWASIRRSRPRTVTREVYSCNICGYCKSVCPEGVDMGALLQFSRAARMSAGVASCRAARLLAARDGLRHLGGRVRLGSARASETCEYAFYPGCQLGADSPSTCCARTSS